MVARHREIKWLVLAILLLAFLLRTLGLGTQSYWYDEGFSVSLAQQSWGRILVGELNLPPLYNLLLGACVRLVGTSEFAGRFLSVFAGVALVALGYVWGSRLLGRGAGLLTALLLAVLPIEVWYAQEARMYAVLAVLTLASSVLLLRLLQGERGRGLWIGYALCNIAAAYTHYYAALVLAAQAVWVAIYLLATRKWGLLRPWLSAHAALALALAPWLPVFWPQWQAANRTYWPGRLTLPWLVKQTALGFAGDGLLAPPARAAALALLCAALALLGLAWAWRQRRGLEASYLLVYLAVPLLCFFAITHTRPKFSARYLLPIAPALVTLAAGGVAGTWTGLRRQGWRLIPLGLVAALGGALALGSAYVATTPLRAADYGRDDLRGAAGYLASTAGSDEAVLLLSGHLEPAFRLYYGGDNCFPVPAQYTPSPSVDDILTPALVDELNGVLAGRRGVWLLLWQDDVVDPNGVVQSLLERNAVEQPVPRAFRGLRLRHYVLQAEARLTWDTPGHHPYEMTTLAGDVRLESGDLPAHAVAGTPVQVLLFWQSLQSTGQDYYVSLRVIDRQGQALVTSEGPLAAPVYPTYRWRVGVPVLGRRMLQLPVTLPPDDYALDAYLYSVDRNTRKLDPQSQQVVRLGEFHVYRPSAPPALETVQIEHRVSARWRELELVGYELSPLAASPGQPVYVTLYWRAAAQPQLHYRPALTLGGQPWQSVTLPAAVTDMQPGDIWRVQAVLRAPRGALAGRQRIAVALADSAGQSLGEAVDLGEIDIRVDERLYEVPGTIQVPRRVDLGGKAILLGYDLQAQELRRGETVHLVLYWQAAGTMETSYKVFTHLLDSSGKVQGQVDNAPVHGGRPTNGWLSGEVLVDEYDIPLSAGAPAGEYVIEVGMYDPATNRRLPTRNEAGALLRDDRILLDAVRLVLDS